MKLFAIALSGALALTTAGTSSAQTQHDTPGSESAQHGSAGSAEASAQMPMMERMPEQCRAMMANMPENCMSAMQEMMQRQGNGSAQTADASSGAEAEQSGATKAYQAAIEKMHEPMAEAIKADDPDVAFVRGMIPHHQSAIDMAKVVQEYGDDDQTKRWAAEIIAAQEREIAEMKEWLEKNAR